VRWICYENQNIDCKEATLIGKKWCEDQNKVVYGTYTFEDHNVREGQAKGSYQFRVHFKPAAKKVKIPNSNPNFSERWITFENQDLDSKQATEYARWWC
jgi:hypothetical protein